MGAMDHRMINGWDEPDDERCIDCDEVWPCAVAEIRRELAEKIRTDADDLDGWPDTQHTMRRTADSIDYEGN